jgi:hypothetical protein
LFDFRELEEDHLWRRRGRAGEEQRHTDQAGVDR